ncbi:OmpA family protein [Hymenobacter tenuis]
MMKVLLTLVLALCWLALYAQEPPRANVYTNLTAQYQLTLPDTSWRQHLSDNKLGVVFTAGPPQNQAIVTVSVRPLSTAQKGSVGRPGAGQQDSVWSRILQQPQAQVLRLQQHAAGSGQELSYQYTFAIRPAATERTRVLGRQLWGSTYIYQVEYQAATALDARYLAAGEELVKSFRLSSSPPRTGYVAQPCDDKMYGIAALRYDNELWEDDCRTIHEFSAADLTRPPKIHRRALPFQSYALAKGFDNCLYAVTKAPTNAPEYVYRYNPATRQGRYTSWKLPAQGPENVWISAATDEQGDLYFMTSDANKLVKVSPTDSTVTLVWASDPLRKAPFYSTIGFAGAGTHGNFCLAPDHTLYQVYSTDGSLLSINLKTRQPAPNLTPISGLPERGGYSDLLLQNDDSGQQRLYLAGPKAIYQVDLERRQASQVRRGIYTDLAGCNVFRAPSLPAPSAAAVAASSWRGRVLDAVSFQPLPQAQLHLGPTGAETTVSLTAQGAFSFLVEPGHATAARAELPGYLPTDSTYMPLAGPYVQDILLKPLAIGTTLRLKNVQFEQGKSRLLPSSYPALRKLVNLLTTNPALTIELRGHTDNVGAADKNVVLSEKRVAAVKLYLVNHGISAARITGIGLGGTEPSASNAQEATRRLNRRVEFRVTGR